MAHDAPKKSVPIPCAPSAERAADTAAARAQLDLLSADPKLQKAAAEQIDRIERGEAPGCGGSGCHDHDPERKR